MWWFLWRFNWEFPSNKVFSTEKFFLKFTLEKASSTRVFSVAHFSWIDNRNNGDGKCLIRSKEKSSYFYLFNSTEEYKYKQPQSLEIEMSSQKKITGAIYECLPCSQFISELAPQWMLLILQRSPRLAGWITHAIQRGLILRAANVHNGELCEQTTWRDWCLGAGNHDFSRFSFSTFHSVSLAHSYSTKLQIWFSDETEQKVVKTANDDNEHNCSYKFMFYDLLITEN